MGKANRNASRKARKATQALAGKGMSTNLKLTLALVVAAVVGITALLTFNRTEKAAPSQVAETLVRPDSHRLSTAADSKVTVVEFLDFECEACGAAYPAVEKLRKEYGSKITYVVRYFPIASHPNAFHAAHAAEAAARQGKFEQMYQKLFDNQQVWSHNEAPQVDKFLGYATELGLDLNKFRTDTAAKEVDDRVRADAADGEKAGVQGTPTFFINGNRFRDEPSYDQLKAAIDAALAK